MFGRKALKQDLLVHAIQTIIDDDKNHLQFTPDYNMIFQKKAHLIFIHDDMAQLQPNHEMINVGSLSGFYPFAYGYTTKPLSFVKKELGLKSFPIALDLKDNSEYAGYIADTSRIRGEIYAIRPQTLISLDTHRQNGVQFERKKVNINIGFKKVRRRKWFNAEGEERCEYILDKEEMITQECWMYIGREEYWKDQLLHPDGFFNFTPVETVQEDRLWLKKYFQYSRVR